MSHKGFVNMGVLRDAIKQLCAEAGLGEVYVDIGEPKRRREVRIEIMERFDIDPTEESNAVSWSNN